MIVRESTKRVDVRKKYTCQSVLTEAVSARREWRMFLRKYRDHHDVSVHGDNGMLFATRVPVDGPMGTHVASPSDEWNAERN